MVAGNIDDLHGDRAVTRTAKSWRSRVSALRFSSCSQMRRMRQPCIRRRRLMMERDGFVRVSVTKASGDGGIDLNAHVTESNDYFSGTHVQVQAKRWRHAVGSVELNKFRGALSSTAKGIFVTTSHFTRAAVAEAKHDAKPSISLVDGHRLSGIVQRLELMVPPTTLCQEIG